ncbi:hypothetical protein NPIL_431311, partial [Nephila pilipes]
MGVAFEKAPAQGGASQSASQSKKRSADAEPKQ